MCGTRHAHGCLDCANQRVKSLDEELTDQLSPYETIADQNPGPDSVVHQKAIRQMVRQQIGKLNGKQRDVLIDRYGLYGEAPKTLEEISKDLGISREAVRQLQCRALAKLQALLQADGWGAEE